MKYNYILKTLLSLILFVVFTLQVKAQLTIYQEGSYVKAEITEEQKDEIMESTTKILNKYAELATFRDDNNNFSEEAYAKFVGLFAGSAEVYNDLAKKNGGNINYATYADRVFEYLQGTGVKYELNNTYLDEISYDSSGFYLITVSFEKIMFNGLDDENQVVNFPNSGRPVLLKMMVEVPEYDLTQATILNILGEAAKIKTESASMVSADVNYHLGSVLKTASLIAPGFDATLPVTYSSYGVDLAYRKSLNQKKSLFLLAGASLGFHGFKSNLADFEGAGTSLVNIKTGPNDIPEAGTVSAKRSTFPSSDNDLEETLNVIDVQFPLGISLRIVEKYNWDIFVDVAVVPTYSLSSSGRYSGGIRYIQLPADETKFDAKFEAKVIELASGDNPIFIDDYFGTTNFDNELVQTASNFSASAQISPVIHYKFNFRLAVEAGLNVNYGFLPYFKNETNHLGTEPSELLNITEVAGAENPSILQNNFKNVSIFRYGAKIGLVFKL